MNDDSDLLRRYVHEGSESAFTELVHRYLDLVHGAAVRRLNGDVHLAADVAQHVFTALAHHARALTTHPALAAWLHRATRNAALTLMKNEHRRRTRETRVALDAAAHCEPLPEWERLRPLLDAAIDELTEPDRTAVVLRFLHRSGYRQIAVTLRVTEDAARMRTERALEKLRRALVRRGVTSSTTALGLVLGQQALSAAPAGLAATISSAALAAPAGGAAVLSTLLMTKLTTPLISGAAAALVTAIAWTATAPGVSADELHALQAENKRLAAAVAPGAPPELAAAVAAEYSARARAISQRMQQRQTERAGATATLAGAASATGTTEAPTGEATGHRDYGIGTVRDSFLTFAWACDTADAKALARMMWFDPDVRAKALATMDTLPATLVSQYPTPEEFYGFITAALCLQAPPPGADIVVQMFEGMTPTEVHPGRLSFPNGYEFQQTPDGWKWVLPEAAVTVLHVLEDSVLTSAAPN